MKKICMCFLTLFICADFSAYATADINADATTATCDYSVLNAYSGTVNMEEIWFPNNIELNWYDGPSQMSGTIQSCDYGETFNVPPAPTPPTGYVFTGWKIRPTMDFSTLSFRCRVGHSKNSSDECYYTLGDEMSQVPCNSDINFAELEPGEWKTSRDNLGTIYGQAYCSKKRGAAFGWRMSNISTWQVADKSTLENYQSQSENRYCWCKVTGYKPASSDIVYGSLYPLGWITVSDFGGDNCLTNVCVTRCVYALNSTSVEFRSALFLPVQNVE